MSSSTSRPSSRAPATPGGAHSSRAVPVPSSAAAQLVSLESSLSPSHAPSDDATFITRPRAAPSGSGSTSVGGMGDPLGMDRVRSLHSQLNGVVGTLNEKVSAVLRKQEAEFLRAYRAHMYSVQKELSVLRSKADDAALQLAKNERIRQLEGERDWYRGEALRLDAFCSALKSDVEYMRDKLSALEDDRAWLETQLKSAKRSMNLMKSEVGSAGSTAGLEPAPPAAAPAAGEGETEPPSPPTAAVAPAQSKSRRHIDAITAAAAGGAAVQVDAREASLRHPPLPAGRSPSPPPPVAHPDTRAALAAALKSVEALKAKNLRLKAANASLRSGRGELETFLLQCLEDVRKEVSRRRVKSVTSSASTPALHAASQSATEAALSRGAGVDTAVQVARAKTVSLADFTSSDRRAVVTRLLEDEYVLQALHDVIFARAAAPAQQEGMAGGSSGEEQEGEGEGGTPDALDSTRGLASPKRGGIMRVPPM